MAVILAIIVLVGFVSVYDYLAARSWMQVTSSTRNGLVFEHRNKEYGAYVIRRDYDKRLMLVLAGLILGIGLIYGTYVGIKAIPAAKEEAPPVDTTLFTIAAPPPEDIPPPPPEEPPPPMEKSVEFTPPVITDEKVEDPPPIQEDMEDTKASTVTNDTPTEDFVVPEEKKEVVVETKKEEPFLIVEEMPEFPGGYTEMMKYIQRNIQYPQMAKEAGISGKCNLKFVVSPSGDITNISVLRGVTGCPECDKEAIRVIKSMPAWKPGKNNGKTVPVYFNLPISFQLK
jgi:periplasmic protein TonB